jgi:hypothetical protein
VLPNPPPFAVPCDLRDRSDTTYAARIALKVNDRVNRGSNLLADCAMRHVDAAHERHRFETTQRVDGTVGVNGRE